jgi:predicted P-loop ATPase
MKKKVLKPKILPNGISASERMEQYIVVKYDVYFNEINGKLYIKKKLDPDFMAMTDYKINSLHREIVKSGIVITLSNLRSTLMSDFVVRVNPMKDYFKGLPMWDQVDYIQQLSDTVTTTNKDLWDRCFKKWIVAYAASLINDDVTNHTVLIFSGGQGVGKTTWLLALVPDLLREYMYSGNINPNNKDTLIQLSECCLIILDELEALNRSEIGALKELITKSSINLRRPYGYSTEQLPRRASFAGSVNNKEFLNDPTGSRRYLCFDVTYINYTHTVSIEKVLAQSKHLYETGFQYWFDQKEIEELQRNNEQFRIMSMEEELLMTYFEPCTKENADHFLSATEIIAFIKQHYQINISESSNTRLGKALKANKYLQIKHKDKRVYAIKEKI